MSKLKLLGGASGINSVAFFYKEADKGIEAIRQEDGTIVTKEISVTQSNKTISKMNKLLFICALFREFALLLNFPGWLYHIPTVILTSIFLLAILPVITNREWRMYHGAEHKVTHWYLKKNPENNIECIKKCSRIHRRCGTNLLATIATFQLVSSICMIYFGFHIPEIITAVLPFFVYCIFPFNLLGMFAQIFTTAKPTDKHIDVALKAFLALAN